MGKFFGALTSSLFAAVLLSAAPALADDDGCGLERLASFDIQPSRNDALIVSAKVAGQDELMALSTASPMSSLTPAVADDLKLERAALTFGDWRRVNGMGMDVTGVWMGRNFETLQGKRLYEMVYAPTLELGGMTGKNIPFSVLPGNNRAVAGSIGADILSRYDIDIDFAANKVTLISRHHCDGKVVYWTRDPYAAVRFHMDEGKHILIPVTLDGESLLASVATGVTYPIMKLDTARRLFGWSSDTPDLKPDADHKGDFNYPFKTLSIGGAVVHSPTVTLADEDLHMKADIILGLSALTPFHVFISYEDKTIYLTGRDAH
jgi:hypothetical protein